VDGPRQVVAPVWRESSGFSRWVLGGKTCRTNTLITRTVVGVLRTGKRPQYLRTCDEPFSQEASGFTEMFVPSRECHVM
jgi:hypothetical protein